VWSSSKECAPARPRAHGDWTAPARNRRGRGRLVGVPSLFVTYGVTHDFFFSGHTAVAVLSTLYISTHEGPLLTAAAVALATFEIVFVLVLRAHWFVDVLTGALVAVAAFALVEMGPA